jgi:hypothetical protein
MISLNLLLTRFAVVCLGVSKTAGEDATEVSPKGSSDLRTLMEDSCLPKSCHKRLRASLISSSPVRDVSGVASDSLDGIGFCVSGFILDGVPSSALDSNVTRTFETAVFRRAPVASSLSRAIGGASCGSGEANGVLGVAASDPKGPRSAFGFEAVHLSDTISVPFRLQSELLPLDALCSRNRTHRRILG